MIDFANKLPRLCELALTYANATGDITAEGDALLNAALVDIPSLGWEAPADLLRLVIREQRARQIEGRELAAFDRDGNGPFCVHGGMPLFCRACDGDAAETLKRTLVALAKAS